MQIEPLRHKTFPSGSDSVACLHSIQLICHKTEMLSANPSLSLPVSASLLAMATTDVSRRLDWRKIPFTNQ